VVGDPEDSVAVYEVVLEFEVMTVPEGGNFNAELQLPVLEAHLSEVMDELGDLAGVENPVIDLDASASPATVRFTMDIEGVDGLAAAETARANVVAAVTADGGILRPQHPTVVNSRPASVPAHA
jgi:hypothetical protein